MFLWDLKPADSGTQIIYNVAPTLLPPELLNDFYSYGAGFPISYVLNNNEIRSMLPLTDHAYPRNQKPVSRVPLYG